MSVQTVKAQLAALQAGITGIQHAYAEPPLAIDGADTPLFVNLTGGATYDWVIAGKDQDLETRVYRMLLYAAARAAGVPGEAEQLCEPFFPRVRDFFASRPSLGGLAGVALAVLLGDSGAVTLTYQSPEARYVGIEFRLQVTEKVTVLPP